MSVRKLLSTITISLLALLCISCAPKYTTVTPELRMQLMQDFKAGRAGLDCEFECAWSFIENQNAMAALYNAQQWEKLAEIVLQIGHNKDISYYLLGRAAEGLGYNEAAIRYYEQSLALSNDPVPNHKCRGSDTCLGFNLAALVPQRIAAVQTAVAPPSVRVADRKTGTPQAAPANPGTQKSRAKAGDRLPLERGWYLPKEESDDILDGPSAETEGVLISYDGKSLNNSAYLYCQITSVQNNGNVYNVRKNCRSSGKMGDDKWVENTKITILGQREFIIYEDGKQKTYTWRCELPK